MGKLKTFRAPPLAIMPWGGGHTRETDPSQNGWTCRQFGRAYLISRKGDKVCASAVRMVRCRLRCRGSRCRCQGWAVALYWNTPDDVVRYLETGHGFDSGGWTIDARYDSLVGGPGWGLTVIELLDIERQNMEACDG